MLIPLQSKFANNNLIYSFAETRSFPANIGFASQFTNCRSLVKIVFPESLATIPRNDNLSALATIVWPQDVTALGYRAFFSGYIPDCIIPEGVTSIGSQALSQSLGRIRLILPSTISSIGSSGCQAIYSKYILCKAVAPPSIDTNAFHVISYLKSIFIYVPTLSIDAYKTAWSYYASRIKSFSDFIVDFPEDAAELGFT